MRVEVAVLGSPSLTVLMLQARAQELYESRGGRPGLPVPDSPYGLCGRKATLNLDLLLVLVSFSSPVGVLVLLPEPVYLCPVCR